MGEPGSNAEDSEVPTLAPGTRLGKYNVVRLLGAGGMGAVYEATHAEIGKRVAIKVLSPMIAAVPGARPRFLREAQLTTRVRHPHIVDVTDMGTDEGQTYLVMEFLSGEDLSQRLDRTGPIPPEELTDIILPVCSAISAAHQAGITHRDLKPQNIFLVTGGRRIHPKVLDFGISKGNDGVGVPSAGTLTATGAMIGTPYYLAPEQILDSKSAGPGSDQYALGVILYECLTGKRPYDGDNLFMVFQGIVGGTPKRPSEHRSGIPAALEEIVLRAMKSDAKTRFASIEELGRALLPFASGRSRLIWEEAFTGGGIPTDAGGAPVWPSASAPTPMPPPTLAAIYQQHGLGTPPLPGASPTPTPPPRPVTPGGQGDVKKTMAQWSLSPAPQGRPAPATPPPRTAPAPYTPVPGNTAVLQPSPTSAPAAADDLDFAPAQRSRKWIGIVIGVAVLAAGAAVLALRGGPEPTPQVAAPPAAAPAPVAAPAAPPPAPAPAPKAAAPAPAVEEVKPAAKAADKPTPVAAPAPPPTPTVDKSRSSHKTRPRGKAQGGGQKQIGVPIVD